MKDHLLKIEYWPLDKLDPYANNPRKNDHAVAKAAAAIKEFGFRVPIVAKSDGTMVDGHLRLKAARHLGLEQVPVVLADDMTEEQIKAFRISVNKMAELANWDYGLLKIEVKALQKIDFNIALTGLSAPEITKIMLEDDNLGNIPGVGTGKESVDLVTCPKCGYKHAVS